MISIASQNRYIQILISWFFNLWYVYLGIIMVFILHYFKLIPNEIKVERFDAVVSSIISVCITIIGFLITIITILIALMERRVMKFLMKHKGEELLSQYFSVPIILGVLIIIFSFYLAIVTGDDFKINNVQIIIMLVLCITFIIGVGRIGYALIFILKQIPIEYGSRVERTVIESSEDEAFVITKD